MERPRLPLGEAQLQVLRIPGSLPRSAVLLAEISGNRLVFGYGQHTPVGLLMCFIGTPRSVHFLGAPLMAVVPMFTALILPPAVGCLADPRVISIFLLLYILSVQRR